MNEQLITQFTKAKELIESSQRILFTTHERTDGDDLGSVLSLANKALEMNKHVDIVTTGGVPTRLQYLPLSDEVLEDIYTKDYDLLIISGCSSLSRINNQNIETLNVPTINFDHHPDNQQYADVNVVDSAKSSVAELVYDFFVFCGWEINQHIATCLLTGIITDTGQLMHANTQASTLTAASELMKKGARISQVTKNTFTNASPEHLRAWGKALENAYFNEDSKVIYSVVTEDQLKSLGNPELADFEGLVETLNKVPEAKFAMFLKEDHGKIKGSLRSEEYKGVDVQKIAKQLGGGGHKLAAGFSMVGKLAKTPAGRWEVVQ